MRGRNAGIILKISEEKEQEFKKWLESPEYSIDGKTLDKIPYEETSNYREKVSKYREDYQRIYGFD